MDSTTRMQIEALIAEKTGSASSMVESQSVAGGCINRTQTITLDDGRQFFVKLNTVDLARMFECEAKGLESLRSAKAIRIPEVLGFGANKSESFLVLEQISSGRQRSNFQQTMGRQLAMVHQQSAGDQFGWSEANYIGSTSQPGGFHADWVEFWAEYRLGFQLNLAAKQGLGGRQLQELGQQLSDRLESIIGSPGEPPVLIHGDLWSGNYMHDEHGEPVLIDPAVYYASREAEFGMTTLFGGFDQSFYDAYQEVWPLADGASSRIEIYRLYHLLNHLNLFGASYLDSCLTILRKYR